MLFIDSQNLFFIFFILFFPLCYFSVDVNGGLLFPKIVDGEFLLLRSIFSGLIFLFFLILNFFIGGFFLTLQKALDVLEMGEKNPTLLNGFRSGYLEFVKEFRGHVINFNFIGRRLLGEAGSYLAMKRRILSGEGERLLDMLSDEGEKFEAHDNII